MRLRLLAAVPTLCVALAVGATTRPAAADDADVQSLIAAGKYTAAETKLRSKIADGEAPVTSDPAIQLEILRRTRLDFNLTPEQVLREVRQSIPDATEADLAAWRKAGDLQHRIIDGEVRYFRSAAGNLFRLSEAARSRRTNVPGETPKKFDLDQHVRELVKSADAQQAAEVFPVKHRINYELTINEGNPRLKPGAMVRVWLPYSQQYRRQQAVKLIDAQPAGAVIADESAPQRTIYFEHQVGDDGKAPPFRVEFEFETSAYCPQLDAAKVKPYDEQGEIYRQYTAERPPHIVFTPEIKKLAQEIVGDETNPLEKARRVFRWVSGNIPWVSEMEYSTIANLSAKGIGARCGDCGVAGLSFVTLCRAAGVPARWQSGWQVKPGNWNMHDWSEIYIEPWGWLPADASYGVRDDDDPRVRDFFCGGIDPYRLIVNLDYGQPLQPPKTSFRSEPVDFQRGEVEIDGHNLYFDEWDWEFGVESTPLSKPTKPAETGAGS